ncbi:hypothetical protein OKC48_06930 [Methylorubrum extorquens]|uniref:hypothetical protein n=1 Tax=Methylorubrum extorquens TaxID=408 RepID=UPI00223911BE|nr:hypothetical protein [Methylorubrum extorquens]UYW28248.1 hypothetical protein OKC48_06930 [Methylorubrum extorquens]
MLPDTDDDLPRDRVLTHQWRCRDAALDACGLGLGARRSSRAALSSLVACAGLAGETDQPWTSFSRRRAWYAARQYNGDLTYDTVLDGMKEGVAAGLFIEDRARPGANRDEDPRQSRYRATPLLIERLGDARFEHRRPISSVLMRDEDGRLVDYAVTERVGRLRRETDALNEWLGGMRVTVDPKKDVPENWTRTEHHLKARKVKDGRETWAFALPTPTPSIVRIFGRGQWDCHGRAYGWWQSLPKDRRLELLINDEVLVEPDFAMLHPTLLYAMAGASAIMPPDVYDTGEHLRDHGKLALNVLLNGKGGFKGAVDTLMWRDDWQETRCYTDLLVGAIAELNAPIARFLGSDAGIRLMGIDSGMAVDVMKRCRKEGIDCLPVHDSFVTPKKHEGHVKAIMGEVLDATKARISGSSKTVSRVELSRAVAREIPKKVPQSPRAAPAAAPAPSPFSSPCPVPSREAGLNEGVCKADFSPVLPLPASPSPSSPPARRAVSWNVEDRLEAMTAYQVALVHAERRDPAFRGLGIDWDHRLALAPAIARDLIEIELETGMRSFSLRVVPDRLSDRERAKAASPRPGRSPRASSPRVKGRRPQASPSRARA